MSVLNCIDAIEQAVDAGEKPNVVKSRILAARDQVNALERDYTKLQVDYDKLVKVDAEQKTIIEDLKAQIAKLQAVDDPSATDLCPYCRRRKGKLVDIKPHKMLGDAGLKIEYYRCTNCNKEYDREQGPSGPQFFGPSCRA